MSKEYAIELVKEELTTRPSAWFPDGNCVDSIELAEKVSGIPAKWEAKFIELGEFSWWQVTLTTTFKYTNAGPYQGTTDTSKPDFLVVTSSKGGSTVTGGHSYC